MAEDEENMEFRISGFKPVHNLMFHGEEGVVGTLSWETGKLAFTGNAVETAKVLFEYLLKPYVDMYIEEELEKFKADPVAMSDHLNKMGFVVMPKKQFAQMNSLLEQRTQERDAARDMTTGIVMSRLSDAGKITRLEADLSDARQRREETVAMCEQLKIELSDARRRLDPIDRAWDDLPGVLIDLKGWSKIIKAVQESQEMRQAVKAAAKEEGK